MSKKQFIHIPPMAELPPAEEINVSEVLRKYLSGEIDLICVLGPTASGKTRYAVQLARQINSLLSERRLRDSGCRVGLDGVAARGPVNGRDPQQSRGRDEVGTCSDEAKTNLSCRYRPIEI